MYDKTARGNDFFLYYFNNLSKYMIVFFKEIILFIFKKMKEVVHFNVPHTPYAI